MQLLQVVALAMLSVWQVAAFPCTPADLASCPKPPGSLPADQVPQFITVTWDDAITPQSYSIVERIMGGLTQRTGCPVPSVFYVTATGSIPAAVQALYLAGNEIATHTVTHPSYPSAEEIEGARTWIVNATGIPEENINGFRAPFLLSNPDMRQALSDAGFLYDSTLPDIVPSAISPSADKQGWPYTMDQGIPQDCTTGVCTEGEAYPLWEIPLWSIADEAGRPIASMDPPGNAYDNYKRALEQRLAGNRAPLGLFLHAGLQTEPARVQQLRDFITYASGLDNVWFVTNQQLLSWMQNPVPASQVAASLACDKPAEISPDFEGTVCDTFVGDCKFGTFDGAECRCTCMGEGAPGGYCPDPATGECTATCA